MSENKSFKKSNIIDGEASETDEEFDCQIKNDLKESIEQVGKYICRTEKHFFFSNLRVSNK